MGRGLIFPEEGNHEVHGAPADNERGQSDHVGRMLGIPHGHWDLHRIDILKESKTF